MDLAQRIGMPGALLFGVVTALLRVVPYIGAWIAAFMAMVMAAAVSPGCLMASTLYTRLSLAFGSGGPGTPHAARLRSFSAARNGVAVAFTVDESSGVSRLVADRRGFSLGFPMEQEKWPINSQAAK